MHNKGRYKKPTNYHSKGNNLTTSVPSVTKHHLQIDAFTNINIWSYSNSARLHVLKNLISEKKKIYKAQLKERPKRYKKSRSKVNLWIDRWRKWQGQKRVRSQEAQSRRQGKKKQGTLIQKTALLLLIFLKMAPNQETTASIHCCLPLQLSHHHPLSPAKP